MKKVQVMIQFQVEKKMNVKVMAVNLNGLYDPDICHELLGTPDIIKKPVNDVIALVENKEMARNAPPSSTLLAMSSFKCQTNPPANSTATPSQADQAIEDTCPDCKSTYKLFTEGTHGWNTKPHPVCIHCYRICYFKKHQPHLPQAPLSTIQALETNPII